MSTVALSFDEQLPSDPQRYERADTDPPQETPHRYMSVRTLADDQAPRAEEWVYRARGAGLTIDGGAAGELFGRGEILVVLTRPLPGGDEEYNRWYDERHLPDVLHVIGGFTAAQRFERLGERAPWPYLAIYEIPPGSLNHCVQRLAWSRSERVEAQAGGREPAVALSPALDDERCAWWYRPV